MIEMSLISYLLDLVMFNLVLSNRSKHSVITQYIITIVSNHHFQLNLKTRMKMVDYHFIRDVPKQTHFH